MDMRLLGAKTWVEANTTSYGMRLWLTMAAGFTRIRPSTGKPKREKNLRRLAKSARITIVPAVRAIAPSERQSAEPLVIKLDLINEVVTKTGVTKTKAEMAVETVFESMKKSLARGDRIELRGFGVFTVRPRKTGIGRNPRTGAEVNIPPGKAVRFKPGKELQSIE
jgi:DNA-binding protein HU-beta